MSLHPAPKLAVFASGEGTTLAALVEASRSGALPAQVALVISNNRDSGALRRARDGAIAHQHLSASTHPEPQALDHAMLEELRAAGIDWIVLAGFMKKVGPLVLSAFEGRIVNTHPALLPRFGGQGLYGRRVHEAVLAAGEAVSGVSVHLVTAGYDEGPVIAQSTVPVLAGDTVDSLAARVQAAERSFLVETMRNLVGK